MSEIITIHVGQCGNTIGTKFWEALCEEHGIDSTGTYHGDSNQQLERINVFFKEATGGRFEPRAILVDLEPGTLETVRKTPYGSLFRPDKSIFGQTGGGNNWAKGYYTEGAELIDNVLDTIRYEAENCRDLQGFILIHSLGGGVGSGMGSLILEKLRDEYHDKVITTFSVFPSPKVSDTVVEPYNVVLSIQKLMKNADLVFCIDNEALFNIAYSTLRITTPTYADFNTILADAMSGITAPLRLPSQEANDFATLQAMVDKLVPGNIVGENRSLHFLTVGLSPLRLREAKQSSVLTLQDTIQQVLNPANMLASESLNGKSLAAVGIVRGQVAMQEVQEHIASLQGDQRMPDNLSILKFDLLPKGLNKAAILIKNDVSIQNMLKRIAEQFTVNFRRKTYLHWYTGEGMDEMEFTEAESYLSDLITAYMNFLANDEPESDGYENYDNE